MEIRTLDHVNIRTSRPQETIAFYCDVLGLVDDADRRPAFDFPGAWLFAGDRAVVHLVYVEADPTGPTGAIDHVAFEASGYLETRAELDARGAEYESSERPESGLFQVFVRDPNDVRIELNFSGLARETA
jgi:catechol 2,3-dioxygenase-like lactoylglutathione lyase family enzyme